MNRLGKEDLSQMGREYFQSLEKERLVEVASNLHKLAVEQLERLEKNSSNSSLPPSSDIFKNRERVIIDDGLEEISVLEKSKCPEETSPEKKESKETGKSTSQGFGKKPPGKQVGAKGMWRSKPLVATQIIPHHPENCAACNQSLEVEPANKPYMGYYVLELEKRDSGIEVTCVLHHYYQGTCECEHQTKEKPLSGYISVVEGRKKDLQLQEYGLVGPMLATFIASLSVRYRISRPKIKELLQDWVSLELSVGTIDRCIREVGIACAPVVEELIAELQSAEIIHLDETPWYEQGKYRWLWVAMSATIAVYHIGSRRKEELLYFITEAFVGWLVTDGYGAYSDYPKRQHCLAHLIRKAIALTEAVEREAADLGRWLLEELRELIHTIATGDGDTDETDSHPARLYRVCRLASVTEHSRLKALAREILADWDAVVACFHNPQLPPTNNEAERALRHAVISRRISYGTRTTEGSLAYCSILSIVETCRLRKADPWSYIAQVLTQARRGIEHPPIPVSC